MLECLKIVRIEIDESLPVIITLLADRVITYFGSTQSDDYTTCISPLLPNKAVVYPERGGGDDQVRLLLGGRVRPDIRFPRMEEPGAGQRRLPLRVA